MGTHNNIIKFLQIKDNVFHLVTGLEQYKKTVINELDQIESQPDVSSFAKVINKYEQRIILTTKRDMLNTMINDLGIIARQCLDITIPTRKRKKRLLSICCGRPVLGEYDNPGRTKTKVVSGLCSKCKDHTTFS